MSIFIYLIFMVLILSSFNANASPDILITSPLHSNILLLNGQLTTDIAIETTSIGLDKDDMVCIYLVELETQISSIQPTCIQLKEAESFLLQNLPVGTYELTLKMNTNADDIKLITSIMNKKRFSIKSIESHTPRVQISELEELYILPSITTTNIATSSTLERLDVPYTFEYPIDTLINNDLIEYYKKSLRVCMEVYSQPQARPTGEVQSQSKSQSTTELGERFAKIPSERDLHVCTSYAELLQLGSLSQSQTQASSNTPTVQHMQGAALVHTHAFVLYSVPVGFYTLVLTVELDSDEHSNSKSGDPNLPDKNAGAMSKKTTRVWMVERSLKVDSLVAHTHHHVPRLQLTHYPLEYTHVASIGSVEVTHGSVEFGFDIHGHSDAIAMVDVCMKIIGSAQSDSLASDAFVLLPLTCVPSDQLQIHLSSVPDGDYELIVDMQLRGTGTAVEDTLFSAILPEILPMSDPATDKYLILPARIPLVMKSPVELVPSYEWTALHVWHTIPSGLTTRLPIGDGVGAGNGLGPVIHKETKISEPWRLQIALPKVSKAVRLKHKYYQSGIPNASLEGAGTESNTGIMRGYCVTKSSFLRLPIVRQTTIASIMYVPLLNVQFFRNNGISLYTDSMYQ